MRPRPPFDVRRSTFGVRRFLLLALAAPALAFGGLADVQVLLDARRAPEAVPLAEAVLHADPQDNEARLLLARCQLAVGDARAALATLEAAPAPFPPDDARYPALLGRASLARADQVGLRAFGLARRGRDALERAAALAPADVSLREDLFAFYRTAPALAGGDAKRARAHAEALHALDPVRGALALALLRLDARDPAGAIDLCGKALAAHPDEPRLLFFIGRTSGDSGLRLEEGERTLRRCLQLPVGADGPGPAELHHRLGRVLARQGRNAEARAAYAACLALSPGHPGATEALRSLR